MAAKKPTEASRLVASSSDVGKASALEATDPAVAAFNLNVLSNFCSLFCFSIAIPDSIDLSTALGQELSASGLYVGLFRAGTALGALGTWLLARTEPEAWRDRQRRALASGLTAALCGAIGYTAVTALIGAADTDAARRRLWVMLLFSRFATGVADGVSDLLAYFAVIHLFSAPERAQRFAVWQSANLFALGAGPVLAAIWAWSLGDVALRFIGVGIAQCAVLSAGLLAVLSSYPDLQEVASKEELLPRPAPAPSESEERLTLPIVVEVSYETDGGGGHRARLRIGFLIGCLLCAFVRVFLSAAVEVGSAAVLEVYLGFSRQQVGFAVGTAFLLSAVMFLAYLRVRERLSPASWVRAFAAVSVLAGLLVIRGPSTMLGIPDAVYVLQLLLASTLVFSASNYANALIIGMQSQRLFPRGSWLDATHLGLWNKLSGSGGRLLAPVVACSVVQASVDAYALTLLALAGLSAIAFEGLAIWPSRQLGKTDLSV